MNYWYYTLLKYDLATFIGKVLATINPGVIYAPNWHIDLIAEHLEAVMRGDIKRLIINMPPRALKSTCISVAWPAWLLAHNPSARIIAASYSLSLSIKHSLDCRVVMESDWYHEVFPDVQITHDQNQKHKFVTTQRGYRYAGSVGGTITGEGGDFLIMDDPMNPVQALSRPTRDAVANWFEHTFASRLDNKKDGAIVLVMQRLHQDDLSGYLLAKKTWTHLCLPALFDEDRHYRFAMFDKKVKKGDTLHGVREDRNTLEQIRKEIGGAVFAAQYQQQPAAEEGRMAQRNWFGRYKEAPPNPERIVQSWDTAIKSGQQHDASVCLTASEFHGRSYILDVRVLRQEYPQLKKTFLEMTAYWKPDVILVEDKASGQQLLQDMKRETVLPVIAVQPKSDKVTRFAAISAMCEAGRVVLPKQSDWLYAFEQELFLFPEYRYDDQADAFSQYLDWLRKQSGSRLSLRPL